MKHLDEFILKSKHEANEKSISDSFEAGGQVYINNMQYNFIRIKLWNDQISMLFPDTYHELNSEKADIKYPYKKRPDIILSLPNDEIDLVLSFVLDAGNDLTNSGKDIMNAMNQAFPANLNYEQGIFNRGKQKIFYFDFRSFSMNGSSYNVMFLCHVHGWMLIGNLTCDFHIYEKWSGYFMEIIQSIRLKDYEVGGCENEG